MNPFVPINRADIVIVDGRISEEIYNNLKELNLKIIKTIKCKEVDESISYHPDIVIHPIDYKTLIIAPNVFDYYEEVLKDTGIKLIKGEKFLGCKYPEDIAYNVGRLNGAALHNFKYTDEKLKFYLQKQNLQLINIKQGYTKCSLAIIGKDMAITADYPIYKSLVSLGFKILLIQPGNITLKGQKYGFIGGTSGSLSQDIVLISGSLDAHPDKNNILNFLNKYNKKIKILSQENLIDIGTIISLNSH